MSLISVDDYTIVTQQEKYINAIETIFLEWANNSQNDGNDDSSIEGCSKKEQIVELLGEQVEFVYYYPQNEKQKIDKSHETGYSNTIIDNINTLFNINEFVLGIVDFDNKNMDTKIIPNLLSLVNQAQLLSGWSVPVIFQHGILTNRLYTGIMCNSNIQRNYNTVCLKNVFAKHRILSGLTELFREHVQQNGTHNENLLIDFDNIIKVSAQVVYRYEILNDKNDNKNVVEAIDLIAHWNNFNEDNIRENNAGDLDRMKTSASWKISFMFSSIYGDHEALLNELMKHSVIHEIPDVEDLSIDEDSDTKISLENQLVELMGDTNKQIDSIFENNDEVIMTKMNEHVTKLIEKYPLITKNLSCMSLSLRLARLLFCNHLEKRKKTVSFFKYWLKFVSLLEDKYDHCTELLLYRESDKPSNCACLSDMLMTLQWCMNQRKKNFDTLDDSTIFGEEEFFDAEEHIDQGNKQLNSLPLVDNQEHPIALSIISELQTADIQQVKNWIRSDVFRYSFLQLASDWPALLPTNELEDAARSVNTALESEIRDDYLEAFRLIKCAERKHLMYTSAVTSLISPWNTKYPNESIPKDNLDIHNLVLDGIQAYYTQSTRIALGGVSLPADSRNTHCEKAVRYLKDLATTQLTESDSYYKRQYILQWDTSNAGMGDKLLSQRLFANVEPNEVTIGSAITDDALFY